MSIAILNHERFTPSERAAAFRWLSDADRAARLANLAGAAGAPLGYTLPGRDPLPVVAARLRWACAAIGPEHSRTLRRLLFDGVGAVEYGFELGRRKPFWAAQLARERLATALTELYRHYDRESAPAAGLPCTVCQGQDRTLIVSESCA